MDPTQLIDAILSLKWLPLAVIVIGYLTRLLADESKFPLSVPARWRPVIVVVLGQVYGGLTLLQSGSTWKVAVVTGLVTSFVTMGLFDLLVKAIFNGQPPWFIDILALIFPSNPPKPTDPTAGSVRKSKRPPPMPVLFMGIFLLVGALGISGCAKFFQGAAIVEEKAACVVAAQDLTVEQIIVKCAIEPGDFQKYEQLLAESRKATKTALEKQSAERQATCAPDAGPPAQTKDAGAPAMKDGGK